MNENQRREFIPFSPYFRLTLVNTYVMVKDAARRAGKDPFFDSPPCSFSSFPVKEEERGVEDGSEISKDRID